jgi:hypothetical protein
MGGASERLGSEVSDDEIPELKPARAKRPLPIGVALAFFLVPAGAFVWMNRGVFLAAPAPTREEVHETAAPPAEPTPVVETPRPSPPRAEPPSEVVPTEAKPERAPDPDLESVKEADRLIEEGENALRDGRGKPSETAQTRAALASFEKARDLLRAYLEKHPDRERFVANRLRQANSQIAWCRKTLPIDVRKE